MNVTTATEMSLGKNRVGRTYNSIIDTVGNTPLVRIERLAKDYGCVPNVFAKLEFFNPLSSVKDRIAVSMIEAMEANGTVGPGSVIVEPTAGNTGIGLAFVRRRAGLHPAGSKTQRDGGQEHCHDPRQRVGALSVHRPVRRI